MCIRDRDGVATAMEWQLNAKWEKEQKEEARLKEEQDRMYKEDEAEARKKEREEFKQQMLDQSEKLMKTDEERYRYRSLCRRICSVNMLLWYETYSTTLVETGFQINVGMHLQTPSVS